MKIKIEILVLYFLLGMNFFTNAQIFTRTYGTIADETGQNAIRTSEGGLALLVNRGNTFDIIKTDSLGNVQWQNNYSYGWGTKIIQTIDGGYAIMGSSRISPYNGGSYSAGLVVKLNSTGGFQWYKSLVGGSYGENYGKDIIQNSVGEYICAANIQHHPDFGGVNYHQSIIKLSSSGNIVWSHAINNSTGNGNCVFTDGTYYYETGATNGVYGNPSYKGNAFLVKYDNNGNQVWLKNYIYAPVVNSNGDFIYSACLLATGEFVMIGYTKNGSTTKTFLIKTDVNGNKIWDNFYGDTISFNDIKLSSDGNVVATGTSTRNTNDLIVYKFNVTNGSAIWSSYFGGSNSDYGSSIIELPNTNLLVFGTTNSFGAGGSDAWLLKLTQYNYLTASAKIGRAHV